MSGATGIKEAIDRLTRYVDTGFNGTEYSVDVNGVVSPELAAVPPTLPDNELGGLRRRLLQVQGATGGFFGIGAVPVTLADLAKASRVNTPADQGLINDGVEEVLTAISQGTGIGGTIAQLLGQGAALATDGGLAAVQIAVMTAVATAAAAQLKLSERIITALDGGGLGPAAGPEYNMLALLNAGLFAEAPDAGDGLGTRYNAVRYLLSRLGEPDSTSPQFYLSQLAARIGASVNGLTVNQQLDAIRQAARSVAGLEAAGIVAQGSAFAFMMQALQCICEGVNGTPEPGPVVGSAPAWAAVACPDDPLLTVTWIPQTAVAPGESVTMVPALNGSPNKWSLTSISGYGPAVAVSASVAVCVSVAVDPGYAGQPTIELRPRVYEFPEATGGRSDILVTDLPPHTPPNHNSFVFYETMSGNSEGFIAYTMTVSVNPGDPPLQPQQFRVYIGRPDPTQTPPE